jgi:hypothetical protein
MEAPDSLEGSRIGARRLEGMPEKLLAPAAAIISGRIVVTGGGFNNPRPLTATTWIALLPDGR